MSGAGSYQAQGAATVEGEAERLRRQAAAVWTRERAALGTAGLERGQRLLDVGCGPGGMLERLAPDLGRPAFGVDLNQDLLHHVNAGHVARADGARLPFKEAVFDFVLVRLVLRHAPTRKQILVDAARVLRTGGTLCVVDVDEAATAFDPEPASWPALKTALAESAVRRGGDPLVGRRLRGLLGEAGLTDLATIALPVSTDDLPPPAFVETLLAPAAREIDPDLLDSAAARRAWDELREWALRAGVFGYALGWMARARKPDGWGAGARA